MAAEDRTQFSAAFLQDNQLTVQHRTGRHAKKRVQFWITVGVVSLFSSPGPPLMVFDTS